MIIKVYDRLSKLQSWLFPGSCLLCAARVPGRHDLCNACEASLPRLRAACPRCAAPRANPPACSDPLPCGRCLSTPPAFDRARALYAYAPPVDRLVQGFKYHRRLDWGRVLGHRFAAHLASLGETADVIVPVPLHRARLRERGYNQSLELARPIARALKLPVAVRGVRRVRPTVPQVGLAHKERRRNVRGAFDTKRDFEGKRVAIVDDILTSGHTVDALARCLRRAGAAQVAVWVLARA